MAKAASDPVLRARLASATLIVRFIVSSLDAHTSRHEATSNWSPCHYQSIGNPAGFLGGGRAVVIFCALLAYVSLPMLCLCC
jgi:hypothetical protein